MKASCTTWPLRSPEHCLSVRDSKIEKFLRTVHHLLRYQHHQEQRAPYLYCRRLEVQLNRYLIHFFQDHDFSLSGPATGHFPAASIRCGFATPSSTLLAPPVSSPCPNANGGIGPLAIGSSD